MDGPAAWAAGPSSCSVVHRLLEAGDAHAVSQYDVACFQQTMNH